VTIDRDPWLSEVLGRPVLRVGDASGEAVARHMRTTPGATYYARVATADTARVAELTGAGLRVVDCGVTLERAPDPAPLAVAEVSEAGEADAAAVARIGGAAFGMSRFHLDPGMRPGEADAIKREWARNCAAGTRGAGTLVTREGAEVTGFLSVVATADARVIDLVAVDPGRRGRGLGRRLVDAFVARWSPDGLTLRVGTQAANVASLRMYEGCGFRVASTAYALHGHT
jgi:ribosomal protein S18 acetylase RimI-like enzyme